MTVTQEQEIARYVGRVRGALADLAPAVRDELLEDLPEHLAEVAAEGGGSLVDRLGPPEVYAAELRATLGISAPPSARNLDDRISTVVAKGRARLRSIDVKTGPVIGYEKTSDFLRLLRPAWWVLRGYLVAMFLALFLSHEPQYGLLPRFDGSSLAGLLLLLGAVIGSIWLGRRAGGFSRWPRLAVNLGSALAILFGLTTLSFASGHRSSPDYSAVYDSNPYSHVQDVYVYDRQGRLVEGARLFDQDGQAIRLGYAWCDEAQMREEVGQIALTYPYCPKWAPFQLPGLESEDLPAVPGAGESPVPSPAPSDAEAASPMPSDSPALSPQPTEAAPGEPSPAG